MCWLFICGVSFPRPRFCALFYPAERGINSQTILILPVGGTDGQAKVKKRKSFLLFGSQQTRESLVEQRQKGVNFRFKNPVQRQHTWAMCIPTAGTAKSWQSLKQDNSRCRHIDTCLRVLLIL